MGMINLKSWDERKESVTELIAELEAKTKHITDATFSSSPRPPCPASATPAGFELRLLDRTGRGDLQETDKVRPGFHCRPARNARRGRAFTGFDANFPQYLIHVDQDLAAKKGVTVDKRHGHAADPDGLATTPPTSSASARCTR